MCTSFWQPIILSLNFGSRTLISFWGNTILLYGLGGTNNEEGVMWPQLCASLSPLVCDLPVVWGRFALSLKRLVSVPAVCSPEQM